ncbi:hypothetical protein [Microtetraspora malaysiensis]|uniref:Uncharacterized protein n=1 Tax=Microtetraspora malaysiensis TaxID=161358 RepID=A0ABW6SKJ6_9ACTN
MSQPSIGRIVHYVSYGTPGGEYRRECRAAIITEIGDDDRVGLSVMNPTGMFFRPLSDGGCSYDRGDGSTGHEGGTWHWPERV